MSVEAPERAKPGRKRSEAADQAILSATLDLLAVHGFGGLTMASVISRSGVSSATLYRRWPTKQELVAAALASLHAEIVDIDTGSLAGDIERTARSVADAMSVKREDLAEDLAVELRRNAEFRVAINETFIVPRLEVLASIIRRARSRGEIGDGIDAKLAMALVSGPLHNLRYVQGEELTDERITSVATAALAAIRAVAPV